MTEPHYVPGRCNIGATEIARRRVVGHFGLAITIILFLIFYSTHANTWWRLLIFFPSSMAAAGYLQAKNRFCMAFAAQGIHKLGGPKSVTAVPDDESKRKDRQKGNKILLYSLIIGILTTTATLVVGHY